ncbi:MAG: murein L,D-transpeptidase catalytic domain family protein [Alphaproteobacteria bacterium]|nr:murein L,D-transpeptidase catalytic domain family protein [Alphaproteobacteria bacterium]
MLDRRALIGSLAVGGFALAARAQPAPDPRGPGAPVPTAPTPPFPSSSAASKSIPLAPDAPALIALAQAQFARLDRRILRHDRLAVVDFGQPSWVPRLHLIDLEAGRLDTRLVAHGCGSDPDFTGWLQGFSNAWGSQASSEGAYRTAAPYHGAHGLSLRLDGLDPTNDNARRRDVVIHTADYVSPQVVRDAGKLGWSEGCFAIDSADRARVLAHLGSGRLLFAARLGAPAAAPAPPLTQRSESAVG